MWKRDEAAKPGAPQPAPAPAQAQQALRPLVSELRKKMESIRRAELARVQGELPPDLQAEIFDRLSKRLLDQVLALPIAALEDADVAPDAAEAQYLRRLFALEPGAPI
jgi:glutamyl-tRNA reductase